MKLLSCLALSIATAGAALSCEPELAITRVSSNSFAVTLFSNTTCDVSGLKIDLGNVTASDQIVPEYGLERFARGEVAETNSSAATFKSALGESFMNTTLFTIVRENAASDRAAPKFIHADAINSTGVSVMVLVSEANTFADSSEVTVTADSAPERRSIWIGADVNPGAGLETRASGSLRIGPKPLANAQSASSTQTICGGLPPAGWITIAITGVCSTVNYTNYIGRTIKRIDTLAAGTSLTVCGDYPPAGWITTAIGGTCATINYTGYNYRTIERIDTLAAGTSLTVCGDYPPAGWITTAIGATCATVNYTSYNYRTIKRIDTLAAGTSLTVCGDYPPAGWITTAIGATCATVNYTSYNYRTIERIDTLAAGKSLSVCGDYPPAGWITTAIGATCATVNYTSYNFRTIERIDTLPVGSTLGICGDQAPSGWVTLSQNGVCARIGYTTYNGSTIRRLK